jgi:Domain of unknown function DUF29
MGSTMLYDEDILAWSEQQAAALRTLAERRDLPNQLDLANVVEEIEDVGKSEFRAVRSLIRNILVHLILLWADPDAPAIRGWRGEITTWHGDLLDQITPSMRSRLDLQPLWHSAVRVASARLEDWDADKAATARAALAGSSCPFDTPSLCAEELDIPAALARLPPQLFDNAGAIYKPPRTPAFRAPLGGNA